MNSLSKIAATISLAAASVAARGECLEQQVARFVPISNGLEITVHGRRPKAIISVWNTSRGVAVQAEITIFREIPRNTYIHGWIELDGYIGPPMYAKPGYVAVSSGDYDHEQIVPFNNRMIFEPVILPLGIIPNLEGMARYTLEVPSAGYLYRATGEVYIGCS